MAQTAPHSPSLIPVHVGLAEPREPEPAAPPQRGSMITRNRRVSPLEDPAFGWSEHNLEPRWLGMESSDCAAAIDPSIYHGRGADELERFLAGARARDELALMITTMGNVSDQRPRPLGATADATISLPGMETYISGARVPDGATISLADDLDSTDRDLALRLRNERADGPWWSLTLSGTEWVSGAGGPSTRHEPSGELQPILLDGLSQPVLAAWTPPDGSQRWYIVPDVCNWHSILDWLAHSGLPQHVPGALRRSRSPLALDPQLQTPDEIAARQSLEELKAAFAEQQRELESQLRQAGAKAEPIRSGLLYGTSTELEIAVAAVLEAAGTNVVKVDELLGATASADLLVSLGENRRLIEVKSASGSATETLVRQLETHLQTWPQLRPDEPVDGGVLIVNHQYRLPPDERSTAVYARPEFVAALSTPVLSTRQLFDWWCESNWVAIREAVLGETTGAAREPDEPSAQTALGTEHHEPRTRRRPFGRRTRSDAE
ncbi:MAG TPA: hypothetical protein VK691_08630 [Solirubrobacteraceae bacterium]|jgi:hypothetical protein|nr:hypothetical protein [Solirubrobacteraceae bacterium]